MIERSEIATSHDVELTSDDEKYDKYEQDINDGNDYVIDGVEIVDSMTKWEIIYLKDYDLRSYRKRLQQSFYSVFNDGFEYYIDGKWNKAKQKLMECQEMFPNDGPTSVLLNVMEKLNFKAPRDWKGNRSLTSK